MTWSKVSDDLHSHPKWMMISPNAKALWTTALSWSNAYLTNGQIDTATNRSTLAIESFGAVPDGNPFDLFDRAAAELVTAKLWKKRRGGWAFHDWHDYQPNAEDEKARKARQKRRHDLHNTAAGRRIKARVVDRDGGLCRYCGTATTTGGGPDSRQFDHVDPDGPNSLANVVTTCARCNRRKSNQTLEDAGMSLLDDSIADRSADRIPDRPLEGRRGRDGSGRVGTGRDGTGLVRDPVPQEPDPDQTEKWIEVQAFEKWIEVQQHTEGEHTA